MILTAIDPGSEKSAVVTLDGERLVAFEILKNEELLLSLRLGAYSEGPLFIEMIASYGMGVGKEVFDTCVWIGKFSEAFQGKKIEYVFRREVKLTLCYSPRANDSNIRAALIDRYGPGKEKAIGTKKKPGPLYGVKADVWAALGVALTAKARLRGAREAL